MLELPPYRMPSLRNLALGLWERASIFLSARRRHHLRADGRAVVPVELSGAAGGRDRARRSSTASPACSASALQHVFAPIGFNWQISIALVPGLAAREVAVGALGTVYALSAAGDAVADALSPVIAAGWSLATALFAAGLVRVRAAVPVDAGRRSSARPTPGAIR